MTDRVQPRRVTEAELRAAVKLIEAHALYLRDAAIKERCWEAGMLFGLYSSAALCVAGAVHKEHGAQGVA